MTTMHPSGHQDGWARAQLPPMAEWPVLHLDAPYDYPARLNCATRLLDDAIAEGAAGEEAAGRAAMDGLPS